MINSLLLLFFVAISSGIQIPDEIHVRLDWSLGRTSHLYDMGIESIHRETNGNWSAWVSPTQLEQLDHYAIGYERVLKPMGRSEDNGYHTHEQMESLFERLGQEYPLLMKRFTIGTSVEGRSLVGAYITGPGGDLEGRPQFKYVGNMHGDETVGREVLIRLVHYLVTNYHTNNDVKLIVDTTRIYILPSMNPDGFHRVRRGNSRGYDLNRNFPDQYRRLTGDGEGNRQPEVLAIMNWSLVNDFVLSANLHGGDLCANYPYDGNARSISGESNPTPDDNLFKELALAYSKAHGRMYTQSSFPRGITNGAHWYVLYGGMQDWNYLNTNDMEITLELSHEKRPRSEQLESYWQENRLPLLTYMKQVNKGAKGKVTRRGVPVGGVEIRVNRIGGATLAHSIKTNKDGWYWRLLTPGDWQVHAGSRVETIFVRGDQTTAERVDFQLE